MTHRTETPHASAHTIAGTLALVLIAAAIVMGSVATSPAAAQEVAPARPAAPLSPELPASTLPGHDAPTNRAAVSPGTARVFGSCNYARRTMHASSQFKFDLRRFPNGGYLTLRYAYARVDSAGRLISNFGYTNWGTPVYHRPAISTTTGYPGSGTTVTVVDWNRFVETKLPVNWGHWVAWVQVGVYDAASRGYLFTPWAGTNGYYNYNSFGTATEASDCWASLTV